MVGAILCSELYLRAIIWILYISPLKHIMEQIFTFLYLLSSFASSWSPVLWTTRNLRSLNINWQIVHLLALNFEYDLMFLPNFNIVSEQIRWITRSNKLSSILPSYNRTSWSVGTGERAGWVLNPHICYDCNLRNHPREANCT